MALTDTLFDTVSSAADRGNIGVLVDINQQEAYCNRVILAVPTVGQVENAVVFGPQSSLTGTLVAGGGGLIGGGNLSGGFQ